MGCILTPPYHFSIVACPPCAPVEDDDGPAEILYRGSIPAVRNFPFVKRLHLRTIILLQKKPLGDGEPLSRWARKHKVEVVWIKAEKMTEESNGMGRTQVSEALKTILDPSAYPLYIADKDGISHTTLLVSCLRKLQGWTPESILDDINRFEPDHEDLPLVPFITSYLASGPSTETLVLPSPPLPSWLWPITSQTSSGLPEKTSGPSSASTTSGLPNSRSNTGLASQARDREPSAKERDRDKEKEKENNRERNPSAPANTGPLPFPNPLTSRKHPTMKLTFPTPPPTSMLPPPTPTAPHSSRLANALTSSEGMTTSPTSSAPALSRVNSRRDRSATATIRREEDQSLMAAATSILAATFGTSGAGDGDGKSTGGAGDQGRKLDPASPQAGIRSGSRAVSEAGQISRGVSGDESLTSGWARARQITLGSEQGSSTSGGGAARGEEEVLMDEEGAAVVDLTESGLLGESQHLVARDSGESSDGLTGEEEAGADETEEEFEDEDDEDEDDDDDDSDGDLQPTSLHISALDLAGYS